MISALSTDGDPLASDADLLVVLVPDPAAPLQGWAAAVDAALGGAVAAAVEDGEVSGKAGRLALFHCGDALAARRVAVVGVGAGAVPDDWREAGRAAARRAGELKTRDLALAPTPEAGPAEVTAFIDGYGQAAYRFDRFKTADDDGPPVHARRLAVHAPRVGEDDLARADRIVEAVAAARDLVNLPANHLTPRRLAERAEALGAEIPGLEVTVLGRARLRRLGAGALLGVAQGSDEPPRLIMMRHRPEAAAGGEVLGLVGKGVTFDTGGISIKPSAGMEEMKMDMGGAAAVIEGTALVARLGLPVELLAVVPATENMPSGRAIKPGDVLTAMNGRTIEVTNTDAEGRLILADALAFAVREGATRLVDLATLTGAMVVALGEVYAGLFGSDPDWTEELRAAAEESGDLAWPMPMHERYRPLIESKVADLSNASPKRQAGAVYAAQFLREFTDGLPWCHLDVAGTAMVDGGGTGYGVRLILSLAERMAAAREL